VKGLVNLEIQAVVKMMKGKPSDDQKGLARSTEAQGFSGE
jgi:hypothetical protein